MHLFQIYYTNNLHNIKKLQNVNLQLNLASKDFFNQFSSVTTFTVFKQAVQFSGGTFFQVSHLMFTYAVEYVFKILSCYYLLLHLSSSVIKFYCANPKPIMVLSSLLPVRVPKTLCTFMDQFFGVWLHHLHRIHLDSEQPIWGDPLLLKLWFYHPDSADTSAASAELLDDCSLIFYIVVLRMHLLQTEILQNNVESTSKLSKHLKCRNTAGFGR